MTNRWGWGSSFDWFPRCFRERGSPALSSSACAGCRKGRAVTNHTQRLAAAVGASYSRKRRGVLARRRTALPYVESTSIDRPQAGVLRLTGILFLFCRCRQRHSQDWRATRSFSRRRYRKMQSPPSLSASRQGSEVSNPFEVNYSVLPRRGFFSLSEGFANEPAGRFPGRRAKCNLPRPRPPSIRSPRG